MKLNVGYALFKVMSQALSGPNHTKQSNNQIDIFLFSIWFLFTLFFFCCFCFSQISFYIWSIIWLNWNKKTKETKWNQSFFFFFLSKIEIYFRVSLTWCYLYIWRRFCLMKFWWNSMSPYNDGCFFFLFIVDRSI